MIKKSVASLRQEMSAVLDAVERGVEVEIQRRSVPIARIIPLRRVVPNRTRLNAGKGSARASKATLVNPVLEDDWEAHRS